MDLIWNSFLVSSFTSETIVNYKNGGGVEDIIWEIFKKCIDQRLQYVKFYS